MARKRLTVADLAAELEVGPEEVLLALWDCGDKDFFELNSPSDVLPERANSRARRALGLPTRRELAAAKFWVTVLDLPTIASLEQLLAEMGVLKPYVSGKLSKKAIQRLISKAKACGRWLLQRREVAPAAAEVVVPAAPRVIPDWPTIGRERVIDFLDSDEVVAIHEELVRDARLSDDPIDPSGVRSRGLLDSSLSRPNTSIGHSLKYPTVEMAASALLHSLVHNHPFHNGNKRTALVSMLVFLDTNGLMLVCDDSEVFRLLLRLASHALVDSPVYGQADDEVLHVAAWLKSRCRVLEQGDRAIQWRALRQILARYGCEFTQPKKGNRLGIERTLRAPGLFGVRRILATQVQRASDGSDAQPNTVRKIRKDLELDDEHNIDSAAFYDGASTPASGFILKYRKVLAKLAKL